MSAANEVALYRKYRPGRFSDVLGQEHVVSVLEGAIEKGNIAHAYLFSGSRGTGKTSVARIIAKEIGTSNNDIYEMDAASNRGIDDIRELRETANTLPFESDYKVYIIDEVHMLTKEAFNALLKTLEEPPGHVIFILATTEIDKLPETIVSRCQTFHFKKPSQKILKDLVLKIAEKEGFELGHSSAELIAMLAEGSFRDAQGILQKVVGSGSGKKIGIEEVERVVGVPRAALVNNLVRAVAEGDLENALGAVRTVVEAGVDMKVFMKLLLQKTRFVMLLRFAKHLEKHIEDSVGEDDFAFLKELAASKDGNIQSGALAELLAAYDATARAYIPQLPLELALVKILGQNSE